MRYLLLVWTLAGCSTEHYAAQGAPVELDGAQAQEDAGGPADASPADLAWGPEGGQGRDGATESSGGADRATPDSGPPGDLAPDSPAPRDPRTYGACDPTKADQCYMGSCIWQCVTYPTTTSTVCARLPAGGATSLKAGDPCGTVLVRGATGLGTPTWCGPGLACYPGQYFSTGQGGTVTMATGTCRAYCRLVTDCLPGGVCDLGAKLPCGLPAGGTRGLVTVPGLGLCLGP